jgi:hypothetical protein
LGEANPKCAASVAILALAEAFSPPVVQLPRALREAIDCYREQRWAELKSQRPAQLREDGETARRGRLISFAFASKRT